MTRFSKIAPLALGAALLTLGVPAVAHHAIQGQFDVDKDLVMEGKLVEVRWVNPHPYIFFDIKGQDGASTTWAFETAAPAALRRAGISGKEAFVRGQSYTIYMHPARNGKPVGLLNAIKLPDGRLIGVASGRSVEAIKAQAGVK